MTVHEARQDAGPGSIGPSGGSESSPAASEGTAMGGAPTDIHTQLRRAVGMVLALAAGLSAVLALFVGLAVNSGPNGVRLAVAGPPAAIAQITDGISQEAGEDAFAVTVVADESAARAALEQRDADGAIVVGPNGPTLLTASAGSPAISQALTAAAASLGGQAPVGAPVQDVVALPATDPHGVGFASGSFPMIVAGLALGVTVGFGLRNRWVALGAVVGGAMVIAVSFAGILSWLGVTTGSYWDVASAICLSVVTSALVVAGLVRVLGPVGAGLAALLLVIVGNPLSGIASSPYLLPAPWGAVGQWLPTGAGGTLLRTIAYFPAASVSEPLLILLGWAVAGAAMMLLGRRMSTGRAAVPTGRAAVPAH